MKTGSVTAPDLARSVIALPPLARFPDLAHDRALSKAPTKNAA